jgi:hypothetical protein
VGIVRSKKLLNGARDQSCVNCGARDGTVVAAHYQGMRSHLLGKGTGHKPHDICVADLCHKCHRAFDLYQISPLDESISSVGDPYAKKIDVSEQFLFNIMKTILRRIDQGILKIGDE